MSTSDPTDVVQRILDAGPKLRFGRGVVSKTTYVAFAIVTVWAIVAWRMSDNLTQNLFLTGAGSVATIFGIWFVRGTQSYAQKNPAQAMLEGTELLAWQKMGLKTKGSRSIEPGPLIDGVAISIAQELGG